MNTMEETPAKDTAVGPTQGEKKPRKDKRARFLDLAEKRTQTVLKKLQVLGNCSNRSSYEYTDADIEKIFSAIDRQVALMRSKFERNRDVEFKL